MSRDPSCLLYAPRPTFFFSTCALLKTRSEGPTVATIFIYLRFHDIPTNPKQAWVWVCGKKGETAAMIVWLPLGFFEPT